MALAPPAQPADASGQDTSLPHAFTTGTLHDPCAWNMDIGTAPSPIPHAFLVSQHTWHQRLGHPGGEVLRRLVSSNFISYNKEKPLILCHACQLGKHRIIRLSTLRLNPGIHLLDVKLKEEVGQSSRFVLKICFEI
ncbi:ribonuclease H-like domain-containing protein [Tanacetum coccineum]